MTYDFMTLGPEDFEALVADLFSKEWGSRLETFKPGADGGIDLRHSRVPDGAPQTIVQCKRYRPDRFSALLRSLEAELDNLVAIQPERYVVATSVPLSDREKGKIMEVLSPWCKRKGDIYGLTELNGLLNEHPEVVQAHFKLWISGTAVLARVLHADVFALSEANLETAKAMVSRLVMHPGFNGALNVLQQRRHAIILGNPGIGKSTLARMLMCHFMRDGFEPVWTTTIGDAWKVAHAALDESKKLFIVLDDFLGRLRFNEKKLEKDEDRSLFALLDFTARHRNLRLVLTTREYILSDAKQASGLLDERSNELQTFTLRLDQYAEAHRARMLFNHLYFSDLPDSRLKALLESRTYRTIIRHRHFNPRVVENISKIANSQSMTDAQYLQYITSEFDNPKNLWSHPFDNEISLLAQRILYVLWTFSGTCEFSRLELATSFLQVESPAENRSFDFNVAFRQLDGNFLGVTKYSNHSASGDVFVVKYENPSVEEFVEQRLIANPPMIRKMVDVVVSISQVTILLTLMDENRAITRGIPDFWDALRLAAARVQNEESGVLVNIEGNEDPRRVWWNELSSLATRMLVLFRIEKKVEASDERASALKDLVLKQDGWLSIIQGSESNDSISHAARGLQRWIVSDSDWPEEHIEQSATALRAAVMTLLRDEDAWSISITSIVDLLDAFLSGASSWLTPEETAIVNLAAAESVNTILNNATDYNEVESEVRQLGTLRVITDSNYDDEVTRLNEFADRLREKEEEQEERKPRLRYTDEREESLDVDALFQGLQDR